MTESYRSPRIIIKDIDTEDVLTGSGNIVINNEIGSTQLSKETDFDSDEEESQEDSPTYKVWWFAKKYIETCTFGSFDNTQYPKRAGFFLQNEW